MIGGLAPTITSTIVIQVTTTIPTTIVPKSTLTTILTKTSTSTFLKLTTSISTALTTQTTKQTSTSTTTIYDVWSVIVPKNPCQPGQHGRIEIDAVRTPAKIFADILELSTSSDKYQDCCNICYRAGFCAYWAISTASNAKGSCIIYTPMEKNGCTTPQCPNGYPPLTLSDRDDNFNYFAGPRGSNVVYESSFMNAMFTYILSLENSFRYLGAT